MVSKDKELVVILHGVATAKGAATLADWTLRLSPLCHSVEPDSQPLKRQHTLMGEVGADLLADPEGQDLGEALGLRADRVAKR